MKNPVTATLRGMLDVRGTAAAAPVAPAADRLDGQTALVTGANRGLGLAVATELARRGAHMILACRSGLPEAEAVIRRAAGSDVDAGHVDLADLRSVYELCDGLVADGIVVDVLVLNAGIVPNSARPTAQGLELMFGVNYLANVALIERMLETGVLRPDRQRRPRIVFVSSESHRGAGPADTTALGRFTPYGAMGSMKVYGHSKFLLTAYAMDLARRLGEGASVHACCPGPIDSDIAREAPGWIKPLLAVVMRRFFRSPAEAAAPVVHLACARDLDERTGTYLHLMNEKRADDACMDPQAGARLLDASRELIARLLQGDTRKVA